MIGEERAPGFYHVDREDITPSLYGRIWRVNLTESPHEASLGNKGVRSIILGEDGVQVRRTDGATTYKMEQIDSVLVEASRPAQATIARWTR